MTSTANARAVIAGAREKRLSVDKLPRLGKLADDIAELTIDAFRTRLCSQVQFRRQAMGADREEAVLAAAGTHVLAALLSDPEWGCTFAVLFEPGFVATLVEVTLGSDGSEPPFTDERAFTTIERALAKCFVDALVLGLSRGVTPLSPASFAFDKFDTRLDFVTLAARGEDAVTLKFRLEALGRGGDMTLVIPQRAIARMGSQLAEPPSSQARRPDPQWTRDFEARVTGAAVHVRAYAEVDGYSLRDVVAFRAGDVLPLAAEAQRDVTLVAEGRRLFTCELGQSEGRYSLRICSEFDPEAHRSRAVPALG